MPRYAMLFTIVALVVGMLAFFAIEGLKKKDNAVGASLLDGKLPEGYRPSQRRGARAGGQGGLTSEQAYQRLMAIVKQAREDSRKFAGSISTAGLRSGGNATNRNSIAAVLGNPNRQVPVPTYHDLIELGAQKDTTAEEGEIEQLIGLLDLETARMLVLELVSKMNEPHHYEPWEVSFASGIALKSLARNDPQGTVAWLEEAGYMKGDFRVVDPVALGWAESDPAASLKYYNEQMAMYAELGDFLFFPGASWKNHTVSQIYTHYAGSDFEGAMAAMAQEQEVWRRYVSFCGIGQGLKNSAQFQILVHSMKSMISQLSPEDRLMVADLPRDLAVIWADVEPDAAMKWYTDLYSGGVAAWAVSRGSGPSPREILIHSWTRQSPEKALAWGSQITDVESKHTVARGFGQNKYELVLKLAQSEPDSDRRFKIAINGTVKSRIMVGSGNVPTIDGIPMIGRMFQQFDQAKAEEMIQTVHDSSLGEEDQTRIIRWIQGRVPQSQTSEEILPAME